MPTTIVTGEQEGFPIFTIHGYFDEPIGKELNALADAVLIKGKPV